MVEQIQSRELIIDQNQIDSNSPISFDWQQGEILVGDIVSYEKNNITVQIEGIKLELKMNEKIGKVGDSVKLQVEKITENKIVLKPYIDNGDVHPIKQYDRIRSILLKEVIPLTKQNIEIAQKMLDNGIKIEKDLLKKIVTAKKQIEQIINTMSKEEAKEFIESPYDIEKVSIEVISRFLSNKGKSNKTVSKEDIEKELKKYVSEETEAIKISIKALIEKDLPVTRKNIDSLVLIQEKLEAVKNMDDKAIEQVVKKKLPHTLNNLYASIFSSGKEKKIKENMIPYEDVGLVEIGEHEFSKDEIINLLKHQEIDTDENHIEAAKFLIKHNIEVNKENLEAVLSLKNEIKNIDRNLVLDKAAQLLKENHNPGKVELMSYFGKKENFLNEKEINKLVRDVKVIDEEVLKRIMRKNLPINLRNLQRELEDSGEENEVIKESNIENEPNYVTAKRQLEEVRLKMTLEAALRLNQKIKINTIPLKELVEELKALEKEYYGEALIRSGAKDSKENVEQLEELYRKLDVVSKSSQSVLPKVIKNETPFIVDDLYRVLLASKDVTLKYEQMETKVEPKLGDDISKIENQLESLLNTQAIEPTKDNIRCSRILVQNNIEVNEDNILHLKLLDEKVEFVSKNLHPIIAANMIKEGFRPDYILIDNVIAYIKGFDEVLGKESKEQFSQFILRLNEESVLTSEEREGMIGIYRMLHTIEKSNGKVIGWLMKNNMSVTLNNLMEGAKYLARNDKNKQEVDILIDDGFGLTDKINYHEKSIKTQLEKAFGEKSNNISKSVEMKIDHYEMILDAFMRTASPEKLLQWINKNSNLYETDLETIYTEYIKKDFNKEEPEEVASSIKKEEIIEFLRSLQNLKKIKQETLVFMEKNRIPMNIKNLQIVSSMLENPFEFGESIEKFNDILKQTNLEENLHKIIREINKELKEGREVEEVLDVFKEKVKEIKQALLESSSEYKQNSWKMGTDIEKMVDIQKQVQKQNNIFQIPVLINGKATNMNVYLLKEGNKKNIIQKDEISAFVSIETENMGVVRFIIHMDEKNVDFKISGENKEITDYLKSKEYIFKSSIENIGYRVIKSQFKEELKELSEKNQENSFIVTYKKHMDSDFEIVI